MKTYVFAIYIGLENDELVEIKVQATDYGKAIGKVKNLLHNHVDTSVTSLYLNDEY